MRGARLTLVPFPERGRAGAVRGRIHRTGGTARNEYKCRSVGKLQGAESGRTGSKCDMNLTERDIDALKHEWEKVVGEGESYFQRVRNAISKAEKADPSVIYSMTVEEGLISLEDRGVVVPAVSDRLAKLVFKIIETSKASPLVSEVDHGDLRVALKEMLAALRFNRYQHWGTHILNDEDRVLGVEPAGQREDTCTFSDAQEEFQSATAKVRDIIGLIFPSDMPVATALARSESSGIKKYRRNTAFIMMWISKDHPELEDVKNCIKEAFKRFGIDAVRSDEIEHSDVTTERVLDEIATSEFLIADLTGERPSVYYEVGYAHALGKRPILYRRAGSPLHFDLAVHNCPEYTNLADLRQKLETRLSIITNKEAAAPASKAG